MITIPYRYYMLSNKSILKPTCYNIYYIICKTLWIVFDRCKNCAIQVLLICYINFNILKYSNIINKYIST